MIEFVECLKNKKLINIGRASDLLWMIFESVEEKRQIEYSLHIQCPWRIRREKEVIVTNNDIYEMNQDFDNDVEFNWDIIGVNIFDVFLQKGLMRNLFVKEVILSEMNDLTISFSNMMFFECFVNTSKEECWRFFKKGNSEHLIIPCDICDDS